MVRVRPPQFPKHFSWLNIPEPLSLKQLKGQVVLLDFWTHGCINCLHMIPTLKRIEQTYGNTVTIIGIHSGKFKAEQTQASIEQAIQRYGITHPVLVDQEFQLCQAYVVKAWPTLILIDQSGYIVHQVVGECEYDNLCHLINPLLTPSLSAAASPTLSLPSPSSAVNTCQISLTEDRDSSSSPSLKFPTKLLATHDLLFIADAGNHRIVVATLDGQITNVIGQGSTGLRDGSFQFSQFNQPQGMAWDADAQKLYVADAGNHCIRQIDFIDQTVSVIAGDGTQSRVIFPHGGKGTQIALNSPWDVALVQDKLYVAMAGNHQIWQMDLASLQLETYLGTGAEGCVDGGSAIAAFAQPSGLTTDGQQLYVVDSETSCIRSLTLDQNPTVSTLCGSGELFGYGDCDGIGAKAQLQHPMDISWADGEKLWIADTYNGKIKQLNLKTLDCKTCYENLTEPNGVASQSHQIYIANTNHHNICQAVEGQSDYQRLHLKSCC